MAEQEKEVAVIPDVTADNKSDSEEEVLNEIGVELEVEVDDEEEDTLIEDASDIGDDEDDMAGIIDIKTEEREV